MRKQVIYLLILSILFSSMRFERLERVKQKLIFHKIKHIDIVMAQIRLETANLTHRNYTENNNLFGFKRNGKVMKFAKVDHSILRYKYDIQSNYKGGDYYEFLQCMFKYKENGGERCVSYCPESNYINKLKEF
jgi:hypothetical protein